MFIEEWLRFTGQNIAAYIPWLKKTFSDALTKSARQDIIQGFSSETWCVPEIRPLAQCLADEFVLSLSDPSSDTASALDLFIKQLEAGFGIYRYYFLADFESETILQVTTGALFRMVVDFQKTIADSSGLVILTQIREFSQMLYDCSEVLVARGEMSWVDAVYLYLLGVGPNLRFILLTELDDEVANVILSPGSGHTIKESDLCEYIKTGFTKLLLEHIKAYHILEQAAQPNSEQSVIESISSQRQELLTVLDTWYHNREKPYTSCSSVTSLPDMTTSTTNPTQDDGYLLFPFAESENDSPIALLDFLNSNMEEILELENYNIAPTLFRFLRCLTPVYRYALAHYIIETEQLLDWRPSLEDWNELYRDLRWLLKSFVSRSKLEKTALTAGSKSTELRNLMFSFKNIRDIDDHASGLTNNMVQFLSPLSVIITNMKLTVSDQGLLMTLLYLYFVPQNCKDNYTLQWTLDFPRRTQVLPPGCPSSDTPSGKEFAAILDKLVRRCRAGYVSDNNIRRHTAKFEFAWWQENFASDLVHPQYERVKSQPFRVIQTHCQFCGDPDHHVRDCATAKKLSQENDIEINFTDGSVKFWLPRSHAENGTNENSKENDNDEDASRIVVRPPDVGSGVLHTKEFKAYFSAKLKVY